MFLMLDHTALVLAWTHVGHTHPIGRHDDEDSFKGTGVESYFM